MVSYLPRQISQSDYEISSNCNKINKLTSVLSVCPDIDHEFRQNIVTAAVDPRGGSRVGLKTTLTML